MARRTASPLPPGPRLPRGLQSLAVDFAPFRFMDACRRRYGDVVLFRTARKPALVVVFDSELVKQLLRGPLVPLQGVDSAAREVIGERSVAGLAAAEHVQVRRQLAPPLHGQRIKAYSRVIRDVADRVIDSWPMGETFALLPSMHSLTFEVVARVVLGLDDAARRAELMRGVRTLTHPGRPRLTRPSRSSRVLDARQLVDELLLDEIARRRAAPDRHEDVLSTLLLTGDEDGGAMTDRELCDQLVTVLIAGSLTTATGLAWAFELLLRHPAILARLEAELARGDEDYLAAVVKETLRLRTPVPFVKRFVRDEPYALGGYLILPGTEIRASIATIHGRAEHYPDPLAFRPERFLGPEPAGGTVWLPFGTGVHRCLGASFATLEMGIVIRRVLERTRLSPAERGPEKAVPDTFLRAPARGVRVVREPRLRCAAAP